jgi:arginyl-tRNA synthetase
LRIFLKLEVVPRLVIPYILDRPRRYGSGLSKPIRSEDARNRLVVEFSSPNITSEIQGKHLRSTIIGAFISRLYESMNWEVTRINYLGDWGKPIALLYVGWTKFGSQESYDTDPVGHLLEVYHQIEGLFQPEQIASRQARDDAAKEGKDEGEAQAEIESKGLFAERNEAFKKLEEGDQEVRVFWERVRNVMVEDYTRFYDRLGVRFDEYSGESQVSAETMIEVEQMLKDKGISEESAGAWMVDMTKLGARAGHAIARDRSGSSTYLLRDLTAVFERSRKYSFDKMIYVVASDNSVHFSQLIKIVEALDKDLASKLQHVKFSESSKMATALGKGYKPQAILDRCKEAVAALSEVDPEKGGLMGDSEDVMQGLATSALLVQELSTRFSTVHAYDTSTLASFKPGSGPDLQYWHAKIQALLDGHSTNTALSDADFGSLADEDQANLLRTLAQYPEVVKTTYHSFEPSGVVAYLTGVAEQLSDCLSEEDEPKVTPGLAALLEATNIVLGNGLGLLGVVPLFPVLPS